MGLQCTIERFLDEDLVVRKEIMKKILIFILFITSSMNCMEKSSPQYIELDNGHKVWTHRVGSGNVPLLLLHGGPGADHQYFTCFENYLDLEKTFQLIYYDQLGCGKSDKPEDLSLWTIERATDEVEQVRKGLELKKGTFCLFGHSYGAMLAIEYALKYPKRAGSLVISNMTASAHSYDTYIQKLRDKMPENVQERVRECEEEQDFEDATYQRYMWEYFYSKYVCQTDPWPESLMRSFENVNAQIAHTMQGPNEFKFTGNLKDWNRWRDLWNIQEPTLIIGGTHGTVDPRDVMNMATKIRISSGTIITEDRATHFAMYDSPEKYFEAVKRVVDF